MNLKINLLIYQTGDFHCPNELAFFQVTYKLERDFETKGCYFFNDFLKSSSFFDPFFCEQN